MDGQNDNDVISTAYRCLYIHRLLYYSYWHCRVYPTVDSIARTQIFVILLTLWSISYLAEVALVSYLAPCSCFLVVPPAVPFIFAVSCLLSFIVYMQRVPTQANQDEAWHRCYDPRPEPNTKWTRNRNLRQEQYDAQIQSEPLRFLGVAALERHANRFECWMGRRESFPLLQVLASGVLCVPASSASSERLFSKAGPTLTKTRRRLKSTRVAQLVTVRGAIACGLLDQY